MANKNASEKTGEKARAKVTDTFLKMLSENEWNAVTLIKVAEEAKISLSDLRAMFDGKVAIWTEFARRVDAKVLENIDDDIAGEIARERLMDILLTRLDALAPHKAAITAVMKALKNDLSLAAQLNKTALVSQTWMLTAAGIDTSGLKGAARVQGAVVMFSKIIGIWLEDEDAGMAKTMAALDKELRKGERMLGRMDRGLDLVQGLSSILQGRPKDCFKSRGSPFGCKRRPAPSADDMPLQEAS